MIPPRAVLAVVSFSETSGVELVLAARLARHCDAELHVLYVEDALLDAAARRAGLDLAAGTHRDLRRFVADAWPAALCAPQTHVVAGAPVEVILDVAHRCCVDLIVVDGGRLSTTERLLFGSTTEGLLRRADVSILVAPSEWTPLLPDAPDLSELGPLVAVIDGPDQPSVAATKAACELASVLGTSVEIVRIVPDREATTRWRSTPDGEARDRVAAARHELELLVRELRCSVPVAMRIETGPVTHGLEQAAPTGRTPMLVLGKRAPSSKGGWPAAIVNRVLSGGTVPILLYVAEQIAQV